MNGKCIYFAIASFLAVLSVLISFLPFFFIILIYLFVLFRFKRFNHTQLAAAVTITLLFFLVSCATSLKNISNIPKNITSFQIEYIQNPKIDGDILQVLARETRYDEKLFIRYKIPSEQEKNNLEDLSVYNRLCLVSGTLEKPKIAKNPNGFDYRSYLAEKQIYWIVDASKNPLLGCTGIKRTPLTVLKQFRFSGVRFLESHFPPEIASLSAALIFGDLSAFDPELLNDYQKTGIVHLLAISGLHVSLLIGIVFYLGIRIGFTRQFMGNFLLILLPVYSILTGASPSVIRSCLMIFLVLFSAKWNRKLKLLPIDALSLAFMIYLLLNPFIIFDVGFQLSFAVSLTIILSAPCIFADCRGKINQMLATSVVAQLGAFPFLLYHYFQMPLIGILANMLYIPLFSFIYLPGLYILFFLQFLLGSTPSFVINLFVYIINFSNQLIDKFGNFSLANFTPGRPNLFFLIIYIALILMIFYIWENKFQLKWKSQLLVCGILIFTLQPAWNWINPFGEVSMIDVGQGDSIFIHLPFNKGDYLIDTGGAISFSEDRWKQRARPFEVGRDIVIPYLKAKGIIKIDKLILTHGDMDHVGGSFSIIKELKVKEIILADIAEESRTEIEIIKSAKKKGIPVIKAFAGEQWESGGNIFYILSPKKNFIGERNSGSLTIYARIGGLTWFFGGDLDRNGEEQIIKHYPNLKVDVLKAGHHGSKTSSSPLFIKTVIPKVALISVGEKNHFGHPHKEVLQLLQKENAHIYRTDLQGAITYQFFREKGTFLPYLQ